MDVSWVRFELDHHEQFLLGYIPLEQRIHHNLWDLFQDRKHDLLPTEWKLFKFGEHN